MSSGTDMDTDVSHSVCVFVCRRLQKEVGGNEKHSKDVFPLEINLKKKVLLYNSMFFGEAKDP